MRKELQQPGGIGRKEHLDLSAREALQEHRNGLAAHRKNDAATPKHSKRPDWQVRWQCHNVSTRTIR